MLVEVFCCFTISNTHTQIMKVLFSQKANRLLVHGDDGIHTDTHAGIVLNPSKLKRRCFATKQRRIDRYLGFVDSLLHLYFIPFLCT